MAKKPNQTPGPETPEEPASNSTTTTTTPTSQEEEDQRPNSQPDTAEQTAAAKVQSDFIDDFDSDEEDLGEDPFEEGKPVKQTPAEGGTTPTPAQSREASTVPQLDANGNPVVPQVPPVQTPVVPPAQTTEQKPTQPATTIPSAETAPVEETVTQVPARTAEEVQGDYRTWRGQTEGLLATHHYKLTQEELDQLDENPGEFIPKIMSKVYLDAVTATLSQVVQYMPQMVRQVNEQSTRSTKTEDKFYEAWPDLRNHHATVVRIGQVYRNLNPNASVEDFINEVGAQTMVALRMQPPAQTPAAKPNGNAAQAQAARAAPFRPAAVSPAGAPPKAEPRNVFDQLTSDFEEVMDED